MASVAPTSGFVSKLPLTITKVMMIDVDVRAGAVIQNYSRVTKVMI
jgi:hypothetical protein